MNNQNHKIVRWLTFMMFMMFAMTTDAVGVIIPEVIEEFGLSLTQAGAFHYATMGAIALSGAILGFLADRIGRKRTILLGLGLYGASSFLFAFGSHFAFFLILLAVSGVAIGVFKTGALALIGDLSSCTREHSATMNTVEGFFGVGAIIGPAIVAALIARGMPWTYLYVIAAFMCVILMIAAAIAPYPHQEQRENDSVGVRQTLTMMRDPYALGFSFAIALYVATEVAIYVWMPTFLQSYEGNAAWLFTYALSIFFVLRAAGRFLGAWVLRRFRWTSVMVVFSAAIFGCFLSSAVFGPSIAVFALPCSGLFMSMMYPTLNSRGISCFPKHQHGSVAGVILFFTAVSAAIAPLLMGAIGDMFGDVRYGFAAAAGFAGILFVAMVFNWRNNPAQARFESVSQGD